MKTNSKILVHLLETINIKIANLIGWWSFVTSAFKRHARVSSKRMQIRRKPKNMRHIVFFIYLELKIFKKLTTADNAVVITKLFPAKVPRAIISQYWTAFYLRTRAFEFCLKALMVFPHSLALHKFMVFMFQTKSTFAHVRLGEV